MADIVRKAQVEWTGDLLKGQGKVSTASGALNNVDYAVRSRFESGPGTNPEELIAAAEASCFTMMTAKLLADRQQAAARIRTRATLTMRAEGGGFKIARIHLETEGEGIDADVFRQAAEQAKVQCPVSKLLRPGLEEITLEVKAAGS